MKNIYQAQPVKIVDIKKEAEDIKLFTFKFINKKDQDGLRFNPGQFFILSVPGFGEAPFAYSSSPEEKKYFQTCIQERGTLTSGLFKLKKGDRLGIRGPYGNGWPKQLFSKRNLLLIGGGLGLFPLRPLIRTIVHAPNKFKKVQIFYGSRSPNLLLFKNEYQLWGKRAQLSLTCDQPAPGWKGHVGVITTLFDCEKLIDNPIALVCGPPIMYKFVVQKLKELGFKDQDIFMSLERRMYCGIGTCQHCVTGTKYVCKDGPVFSYAELKEMPGAI